MGIRTKNVIAAAALGLGAALLAGCAGGGINAYVLHLDKDGPATYALTIGVGETITVADDSFNASVGDAWSVVQQPDASVLEALGEDYQPDGGEQIPGGSGVLSFGYRGVAPGDADIVLRYELRGGEGWETTVSVAVE